MQRNASGVLGCACQQNQLGAVADYDLIRIGGRDYSAAELQTKAPTIFAQTDTKVYTSAFDNSAVKYVTKAGNPLGKFYSYLKPGPNRSRSWLMLETGPVRYVFVPNEVVGASAIANQNVQTAQEQIAQEKDAAERENDPVLYYLKKVGVPLALGAAAVYLIATFGKTFLAAKLSSKPALSGPGGSKMWWVAGGAIALIGGAWYYLKGKNKTATSNDFINASQIAANVPDNLHKDIFNAINNATSDTSKKRNWIGIDPSYSEEFINASQIAANVPDNLHKDIIFNAINNATSDTSKKRNWIGIDPSYSEELDEQPTRRNKYLEGLLR